MKSALLPVLVLVLSATAACGDDAASGLGDGDIDAGNGSGDAGDRDGSGGDTDVVEADVSVDAAPDVAPDAEEDTLEVDVEVPDVAPDSAADVAVEDTAPVDDAGETFADPYADGPYRIEEVAIEVPLSDDTSVAAIAYIPDYREDAPFPWVILSHGFQLEGAQFASYAQRLATHGIVTIVPTYGDVIWAPRTHTTLAADVISIMDWALEQTSSPGVLEGLLDPERIGAAGHSRGGKQSIHAATLDDRIAAVFTLDAVDSGPPIGNNPVDYPSVTPELMGSLAIPTGYVGTGRGAGGFPPCAPDDNNYNSYFEASPTASFAWLIPDAGHNDFTDFCDNIIVCNACRGGADPDFSRTFGRATMVAFFEVFLAGDELYRPWVDGAAVTSLAETEAITFSER